MPTLCTDDLIHGTAKTVNFISANDIYEMCSETEILTPLYGLGSVPLESEASAPTIELPRFSNVYLLFLNHIIISIPM